MTWIVQTLERKDADGQPSGLFHLTAKSDESGGFVVGCNHDHASAEEASSCILAREAIGKATGFPAQELGDDCQRPTGRDEAAIESEIQAKGLTAPRLTPADIYAAIVSEAFYVFPGTTLTVCCLTLRNGFTVTGESAAASPENFDREIGQKIAFENARQKVWAFEGYLLRERLSGGSV